MKATIAESYTLPSKGLIYKTPINPEVTIRSMTLAEEMRRTQLQQNKDEAYRMMSDIIDDCIETKLPISSYDMCLGDYQFLLHKLRIITYGPEYKMAILCSNCGERNDLTINLDDLKVIEIPENYQELTEITLPRTKDVIKLKFQTPRMLDMIAKERRDMKKQFPDLEGDPTILIELQNVIEEVNGKKMPKLGLQEYIKNLPMMDIQYLLQGASKLSDCIGIDPSIKFKCDSCGVENDASFRFTLEFFTPTY